MDDERAVFIRSYSNVPENLRMDIIIVLGEKPYSWDAVYFEVKENTELGNKLLKKMKEIGLI